MESYEEVDSGAQAPSPAESPSGLSLDADLIRNPWVIGGAALVFGLILGVVYAWLINPIDWVDAPIDLLRADLQEDYARMVVDSYTVNDDLELASQRIAALGENAPEIMARVAANPQSQNTDSLNELLTITSGELTPQEPEGEAQLPIGDPAPAGGGLFSVRTLLLVMCAFTVVLAAALVVLFVLRSRGEAVPKSTESQALEYSREAEATDYVALGADQPLSQWMTTYLIGDDLFDDSFSIDSPNGEFMGECGVGIAETIGVGEPKRVSAFEVWLFDKNDIQTVTKVVMSANAFEDAATLDRLAAKGEPVLANPAVEVVLETATLQLVGRIVDLSYGDGAMPAQSFFERMTIELAVWSKV